MKKHNGILLVAAGLSLVCTGIEKAAALRNQNRRKGNLYLRMRNGPAQNSGFFLFRRRADLFRLLSIVRLTFAYIAPNIEEFTHFDFFGMLSEDERQNFIRYTGFGNEALDCLRICSFSNKKLDGIFLSGTNLRYKSITNSNIRNANFRNANLAGAYLLHCDFSLSVFEYAYCHNTDFSNSTLCSCSFENARLNGANFTGADLSHADLRGAILTKCRFDGANLFGTKISVEQLRNIYSFDIDFFRKNKIEVYLGSAEKQEKV